MNNIQKAAVIGCGFVGSSIAFTLMQSGIFSELVLIDANRDKAEGEAMDLSHGLPFTHPMDIRAGDYDDVADCALVIRRCGAEAGGDPAGSGAQECGHFQEYHPGDRPAQ